MATEKVNYAEAIAEVERILQRIQDEEISIDTLSSEVKRAMELLAACRKRLLKTEEEIGKILEN